MNELQQEIFDEIVDHLVPTLDKYDDEDSLFVLEVIVSIVKEALDNERMD